MFFGGQNAFDKGDEVPYQLFLQSLILVVLLVATRTPNRNLPSWLDEQMASLSGNPVNQMLERCTRSRRDGVTMYAKYPRGIFASSTQGQRILLGPHTQRARRLDRNIISRVSRGVDSCTAIFCCLECLLLGLCLSRSQCPLQASISKCPFLVLCVV